jgi:hypothetical protein
MTRRQFSIGDRVEVRENEGVTIGGKDVSGFLFSGTVTALDVAGGQIAVRDDEEGDIFHCRPDELRRITPPPPRARAASRSDYYTATKVETSAAMTTLREWFPEGLANDLNVVLFSTSGVHGTYTTIEQAEESKEPTEITFLVLRPRTVQTFYGNCRPETADDFAFLKRLRASSREILGRL